jgi:hypothetical protein
MHCSGYGQKDDSGLRLAFQDSPSCIDTVEERHRDVENRDVGLQRVAHGNGCVPVRSLADDLEPLVLQEGPEAFSDHHVIIGKHDPHTLA